MTAATLPGVTAELLPDTDTCIPCEARRPGQWHTTCGQPASVRILVRCTGRCDSRPFTRFVCDDCFTRIRTDGANCTTCYAPAPYLGML